MKESMKDMRVAIVGAGAVGGYYGGRLAEAGVDVKFLLRSDYEEIKNHGLAVESIAGDFTLPEVQCARSSSEIGPVDLVIVAWKATANAHYDEVISPLLHDETLILTLQNGLGNCEKLATLFGAERVFGGLCFICVNRLSAGKIRHSSSGQIRIGEYVPDGSNRLMNLVGFLGVHGISARAVENLEKAQWMKLVWNIPFNGLAISEGGVDTQVLLSRGGMELRVRKLMAEVQEVARALGYAIDDGFIDQQVNATYEMAAYKPSSMLDFMSGRQIELDAIWLQPHRVANELGVHVPELKRLVDEIKGQIEN